MFPYRSDPPLDDKLLMDFLDRRSDWLLSRGSVGDESAEPWPVGGGVRTLSWWLDLFKTSLGTLYTGEVALARLALWLLPGLQKHK